MFPCKIDNNINNVHFYNGEDTEIIFIVKKIQEIIGLSFDNNWDGYILYNFIF